MMPPMDHAKLIAEIDAHLATAGYGDDRFGALAANNGRLMKRLRAGKRIWPDTEMKIWIYLATGIPAKRQKTGE